MAFHLDPGMEQYVVSHGTVYGPAGEALVAATAALGDAADMLGKEQYALFRLLSGLLGCRRALDVGTFTGLSALALAEGMGTGGRVVTIDRNRAWIDMARRFWDMAGVAGRIDARVGEAADVLASLPSGEPFDIAFLELLLVDNVLWHRWVLDPARRDADTDGMRRFNDRLACDARVEVSMLPVADGLTLVRRKA